MVTTHNLHVLCRLDKILSKQWVSCCPTLIIILVASFHVATAFKAPTTTTMTITSIQRFYREWGYYSSQSSRRNSIFSPLYFSSTGDNDFPPPPDGDDRNRKGGWEDFLTPREESKNLQRAREYMSETSLPISFSTTDNDDEEEDEDDNDEEEEEIDLLQQIEDEENEKRRQELLSAETSLSSSSSAKESSTKKDEKPAATPTTSSSSALSFAQKEQSSLKPKFDQTGEPTADALAMNPYLQVVTKIAPSDLISKFTSTAPPRVQNAVRSTVLGLIGSLPKMAFDTTTITTGQRLAGLMFQLQMTGYMFKNAEYRLSLSQSLGLPSNDMKQGNSNVLLRSAGDDDDDDDEDDDDDNATKKILAGKVRGKVKVRYGASLSADSLDSPESAQGNSTTATKSSSSSSSSSSSGMEVEVDAAAYMSELRGEVAKLRDELSMKRQAKAEELRKDLLLYIRTLPGQELKQLTTTISPDVLVSMKGLVNAVLAGIGDGDIGPDTVTEQSGEAMAQLCMWQLVVGYNLRELEVREEFKKSLKGSTSTEASNALGSSNDFEGGVDFSAPGALE